MEKELKIVPPEGFEIDRENSTLECIKFKPCEKKWRDQNNAVSGYFLNGDIVRLFDKDYWKGWYGNHDVFSTEKQAKSALSMAQISQIMTNDPRFGGVVTDEEWKDTTFKFVINRVQNTISKAVSGLGYEFLAFHTEEQRDLFLEENEDLVKGYLMLD